MRNNDSIYKYLFQSEKIIWSGKPNYKRVFQNSDLYKIPLSLLFLAILINNTIPDTPIKLGYISFANSNPNASGDRSLFIPFIIVAIYLAIGRFFFRAHSLKNTRYYLTNRRLFVYSSALFKTVVNTSEDYTNGVNKWSYSRYPVIGGTPSIVCQSEISESDVKILYRNIYGDMDLKVAKYGFWSRMMNSNKGVIILRIENIEDAELIIDIMDELIEKEKYDRFTKWEGKDEKKPNGRIHQL